MKNSLAFFFLLMIAKTLAGQITASDGLTALDKKYGFKEAIFETPFSDFHGLVEVTDHENAYYKAERAYLNVDKYVASEVFYTFYKKHLYQIRVDILGERNCVGILEYLQSNYGAGIKNTPDSNEYHWLGEKVFMTFEYNKAEESAILKLTCAKLMTPEFRENLKKNIQTEK
jgi:hypothetical protein